MVDRTLNRRQFVMLAGASAVIHSHLPVPLKSKRLLQLDPPITLFASVTG